MRTIVVVIVIGSSSCGGILSELAAGVGERVKHLEACTWSHQTGLSIWEHERHGDYFPTEG